MKIPKKYLSRHHLDAYSEMEFSNYLFDKGFQPFFPFKDKGVDIIAFKNNNFELYQLKARKWSRRHPWYYWFPIKRKDIKKLKSLKNKRTYFILCALQTNQKFHFFKVPLKIIEEYFKKTPKTRFFKINKVEDKKYEISPKRIKININRYLLDN